MAKQLHAAITATNRQEATVERLGAPVAWWRAQWLAALERVKTPGGFSELAEAEFAAIEWGARDAVSVFVAECYGQEAREMSPDEARDLAFDLLALADLLDTEPASGGEQ